jgi:uncharacterized BrkB/YihY/UPF0761 family membrane protein
MSTINKQDGAVIIIALLFLLLTAMISTTAMHTSIMEVRMANNGQLKEEAFQQVQAVANAITANPNNLVVVGDIGYTICATGVEAVEKLRKIHFSSRIYAINPVK